MGEALVTGVRGGAQGWGERDWIRTAVAEDRVARTRFQRCSLEATRLRSGPNQRGNEFGGVWPVPCVRAVLPTQNILTLVLGPAPSDLRRSLPPVRVKRSRPVVRRIPTSIFSSAYIFPRLPRRCGFWGGDSRAAPDASPSTLSRRRPYVFEADEDFPFRSSGSAADENPPTRDMCRLVPRRGVAWCLSGLACAGGDGFVLGWALIRGSAVGRVWGNGTPGNRPRNCRAWVRGRDGRRGRVSAGREEGLSARRRRGRRRGVDRNPPGDLADVRCGRERYGDSG